MVLASSAKEKRAVGSKMGDNNLGEKTGVCTTEQYSEHKLFSTPCEMYFVPTFDKTAPPSSDFAR